MASTPDRRSVVPHEHPPSAARATGFGFRHVYEDVPRGQVCISEKSSYGWIIVQIFLLPFFFFFGSKFNLLGIRPACDSGYVDSIFARRSVSIASRSLTHGCMNLFEVPLLLLLPTARARVCTSMTNSMFRVLDL